ncbi:relaxase/mobilization nuclease domain-containing protein [Dysgonomonas sp. Marseille-P4677]|uniref:conjugal transfer protein MobB n=1 Tax=Dysgonomonas sp. Marseille-P4677 TaxID=2364790 RepID=UPI00191319A5|nr:conjugal transfer protein MobB [Dysgonomonas sp. Marseille-P4677]MBK5719552.1 relaxase/mobilization nuclease domain-containing protein [Dysgonomonas sp. Marseille-P4677]
MVAKINTGSNLFGTLLYNNRKVENDVASIIHSNKVMQNKDGKYNMFLCNQSFAPFLAANRKTEEPILHISLNPHPDDVLTDEQFTDIADEYMQKMGFGDQPYIVFKHEDLERKHIHIVSVNVDETGRKISDYNNYHRSKKITEELETKYKLHPAGKMDYQEEVPHLKKVDYSAGNVKKQIANNVKALMQSYRFSSLNEYRALLSLYNIGVEEVSGEARGKPYRGLVYSALDGEGNKAGSPIKSSSIARSVGHAALAKKIASSVKLAKEKQLTGHTKAVLDTAISNYRNRESFEAELLRNGISVVFRQNEEGRIYGATFIDHETRTVVNGSKIGKAYSANVFHNLFQNSGENETLHTGQSARNEEKNDIMLPLPELNMAALPEAQEDSGHQLYNFPENRGDRQPDDSGFAGITSLLEQHGTDFEAEAFARKKEAETRRRKRQRRHL